MPVQVQVLVNARANLKTIALILLADGLLRDKLRDANAKMEVLASPMK
jgi:hypothetical protein